MSQPEPVVISILALAQLLLPGDARAVLRAALARDAYFFIVAATDLATLRGALGTCHAAVAPAGDPSVLTQLSSYLHVVPDAHLQAVPLVPGAVEPPVLAPSVRLASAAEAPLWVPDSACVRVPPEIRRWQPPPVTSNPDGGHRA